MNYFKDANLKLGRKMVVINQPLPLKPRKHHRQAKPELQMQQMYTWAKREVRRRGKGNAQEASCSNISVQNRQHT